MGTILEIGGITIVGMLLGYLLYLLKQKNRLLQANELLLQANASKKERLKQQNGELMRRKRELLEKIQERQLMNELLQSIILQLRQMVIPNSDILRTLKQTPTCLTYDDWQKLFMIMDASCPHFRERLMKEHPGVSENDVKYCCLIYFSFTVNEIAILMNVLPESVMTRKKRILNKINRTSPQKELDAYLLRM